MAATLDQAIADLTAQVKKTTDTEDSATVLVNGIPAMIKTAVDKALALGATPAQLQSFADLQAALTAHADPLAAAVVANTPAATP